MLFNYLGILAQTLSDRQLREGGKEPSDGKDCKQRCDFQTVTALDWIHPFFFIPQAHKHAPLLTFPFVPRYHSRFRSVTHLFGEVGHTHSAIDQRFSVLATAFNSTDVLQTPQARFEMIS